ncbi:exopolysaccharide production repressor protein [Mesorhizobium mediterraneum]|uniref:exopolysaccharide production repressor protein n=1 Tax=Mesorhizobium mediterraneum TaxID=43617 RepID=UPI001782728C|nr:exopolysaccharide production repressor protein [Mesorhizobium mediterraneum]
MNVLQFLVGMLTMSFIVAISTYWATGSIWKATGGTVIALIVLQIGYFAYLLWAANRPGAEAAEDATPRALPGSAMELVSGSRAFFQPSEINWRRRNAAKTNR